MAAIKCNLCGYEATDGRVMHGHLMRLHEKEYRKTGLDMEQICSGYSRSKSNNTKRARKAPQRKKEVEKPDGLRLLNTTDPAELTAYNQGYRYIDDDENVYTSDELKEMGVI